MASGPSETLSKPTRWPRVHDQRLRPTPTAPSGPNPALEESGTAAGGSLFLSKAANRLQVVAKQLADGESDIVKADVANWMSSCTESVALRRDFHCTYPVPNGAEDLQAVPVDDTMAHIVFDTTGLRERDKQFLERRHAIWRTGFDNAYVAVDAVGNPVFLSWFIEHRHASQAKQYWGPLFPDLQPDMLIGEGAWVPPAFRKAGVMGAGMYVCTEAAKSNAAPGVRYVTAYAESTNRGAVLGTYRGGFDVIARRLETWRLGRRTVSFEPATVGNFSVFDGVDLTH